MKLLEKYVYSAHILRVYDGDTIYAEISLGFDTTIKETFRLARINAPEVRGEERDRGIIARDYLREKILGRDVTIKTHKDSKEKYGRYLADIFYIDENELGFAKPRCINDELVEKGFAIYKDY